jgi:hypothetical protein
MAAALPPGAASAPVEPGRERLHAEHAALIAAAQARRN